MPRSESSSSGSALAAPSPRCCSFARDPQTAQVECSNCAITQVLECTQGWDPKRKIGHGGSCLVFVGRLWGLLNVAVKQLKSASR